MRLTRHNASILPLILLAFGLPAPAALTPQFLYSPQMGTTHVTHTTFVKGQPQWFSLQPVWATPMTCDSTSLTCVTDGTYQPIGTETSVTVMSNGGTMPGYQYGSFTSRTSSGVTTLTLVSGTPFSASMVGHQIETGSAPGGYPPYANSWTENYHTVLSYIDPNHITVDTYKEGDQTQATPYWYGGLWGQYGGDRATYDVCNVNPSTHRFEFHQHINGQTCLTEPVQPFITNGSNLYLVINSTACYLNPTVSGLPDGSTVNWVNVYGQTITNPGAPGYLLQVCGNSYPLYLKVTVPTSAVNGSYNLGVTVSQNADGSGSHSTHTFPINVMDTPKLRGSPASYPALPGLSTWATAEKQYLDYFCDKTSGTLINQGGHSTVNVAGTAVTLVGGSPFDSGVTYSVFVNGTHYYGATFVDANHVTLPSPGGNMTNATFSWNSAWDASVGFILGNGSEPIALYYPDGILSYLFGYRHWNDPGYRACALTIGEMYAQAVNNVSWPTAGSMQFQEVFGWGLFQLWKMTGNSTYATAIDNMARQPCCARGYPSMSGQLGWGGLPGFREGLLGLDLETAWSQINAVPYQYGPVGGADSDGLQGTPNNNLSLDRSSMLKGQLISEILNKADYPCDGCSQASQPFIDGTYTAHTLRHLDEISNDDYILYVSKRMADFLTQWYDLTTAHGFVYNTSYNFVGCSAGLNSDSTSYRFGPGHMWFDQGASLDGMCGYNSGTKAYGDASLNMGANLWSYVWKNTGIDLYRQYAYDAFQGVANMSACCGYQPKQFNQMFGYDGISQIVEDAAPPPSGGCSDLTFLPVADAVTSKGGSGTITVTVSDQSCQWTASSSAPWLTISSGGSGTGNGFIGWTAAPNPGALRRGTITAAQAQFTVRQNPPALRWSGSGGSGAKVQ